MSKIQSNRLESYLLSSTQEESYAKMIRQMKFNDIVYYLKEEGKTIRSANFHNLLARVKSHYAIIILGAISRYFPKELNEKIQDDITRIFEIEPIREYYKFKIDSKWPDIIFSYSQAIRNGIEMLFFKSETNADSINPDAIFMRFLEIRISLNSDNDITAFRRFISQVNQEDPDLAISNFVNSFEDLLTKPGIRFTKQPEIHEGNELYGALAFLSHINEYQRIINDADFNPVLASAIWNFHSYYFENMAFSLKQIYEGLWVNLERELENLPNLLKEYIEDNDVSIKTDMTILKKALWLQFKSIDQLCFNDSYSLPIAEVSNEVADKLGLHVYY